MKTAGFRPEKGIPRVSPPVITEANQFTNQPKGFPVAKETPATLDTHDLAKLLNVSERHIANMDKSGQLPAPVRLGRLKRWTSTSIEVWLSAGCPGREECSSAQAV